MRIAAFIAAAALSSCSLATVRGPVAGQQPPNCTKSAGLPIVVDSAMAIAYASGAGAAFDESAQANGDDALAPVIGGAALLGLAVVSTVSAIVGWRRSDACRSAWDAHLGAPVTRP
jgi:hypothetical protein